VALVVEGLRQRCGQSDVVVHAAQDQGAEIRREGAAIEIAANRQPVDWEKSELFLGRF